MSNSEVTFLILNYNSRSLVRELVNQLKSYDKNLPICIVDNSNEVNYIQKDLSTFNHIAIIDANQNLGYARGNNLGLNYIKDNGPTDYVCVCNPDIRIDQTNFNLLMDIIQEGPVSDIFGIRLVDDDNKELVSEWSQASLLDDIINDSAILKFFSYPFKKKNKANVYKEYVNIQRADIITGAFFIAKLKTFYEVGFFDERTFLFCEERILARRLDARRIKRTMYNNVIGTHSTSVTIKKKYNSKFRRHLLLVQARLIYYRYYRNKVFMWVYALSAIFSLSEKILLDIVLRLNNQR